MKLHKETTMADPKKPSELFTELRNQFWTASFGKAGIDAGGDFIDPDDTHPALKYPTRPTTAPERAVFDLVQLNGRQRSVLDPLTGGTDNQIFKDYQHWFGTVFSDGTLGGAAVLKNGPQTINDAAQATSYVNAVAFQRAVMRVNDAVEHGRVVTNTDVDLNVAQVRYELEREGPLVGRTISMRNEQEARNLGIGPVQYHIIKGQITMPDALTPQVAAPAQSTAAQDPTKMAGPLLEARTKAFDDAREEILFSGTGITREVRDQRGFIDGVNTVLAPHKEAWTRLSSTNDRWSEWRHSMGTLTVQYREAVRLHGEDSKEAQTYQTALAVVGRARETFVARNGNNPETMARDYKADKKPDALDNDSYVTKVNDTYLAWGDGFAGSLNITAQSIASPAHGVSQATYGHVDPKVQLRLEALGFSTGGRNHRRFEANKETAQMDGLSGPMTSAALETFKQWYKDTHNGTELTPDQVLPKLQELGDAKLAIMRSRRAAGQQVAINTPVTGGQDADAALAQAGGRRTGANGQAV
jgi:hypothetical protein